MSISTVCSCGAKLKAPDDAAGKRVFCPKCKARLIVPSRESNLDAAPPTGPLPKATAKTFTWPPPQATDYPWMRRSLTMIRARRQTRAILDVSGFGPSSLGRLCLVFIICVLLFGVSLFLSFASHDPPMYAAAKAAAILIVAFAPFLVLVLGPSDEDLARRLDYIFTYLPITEAAWRGHKNQLAAERLSQEQERAEQEEELEQEDGRERAFRSAGERRRRPPNLVVTSTKNIGISIILTFLLGPLGMLYSTVPGGLIMMVLTLFVGLFTCGLGLIITWPLCIIWGALATSSYNRKLLRGQRYD